MLTRYQRFEGWLSAGAEKAAGFVTKYLDLLVSEEGVACPTKRASTFEGRRSRERPSLGKTTCPIQRDLLTKQQRKVLTGRGNMAEVSPGKATPLVEGNAP